MENTEYNQNVADFMKKAYKVKHEILEDLEKRVKRGLTKAEVLNYFRNLNIEKRVNDSFVAEFMPVMYDLIILDQGNESLIINLETIEKLGMTGFQIVRMGWNDPRLCFESARKIVGMHFFTVDDMLKHIGDYFFNGLKKIYDDKNLDENSFNNEIKDWADAMPK